MGFYCGGGWVRILGVDGLEGGGEDLIGDGDGGLLGLEGLRGIVVEGVDYHSKAAPRCRGANAKKRRRNEEMGDLPDSETVGNGGLADEEGVGGVWGVEGVEGVGEVDGVSSDWGNWRLELRTWVRRCDSSIWALSWS